VRVEISLSMELPCP